MKKQFDALLKKAMWTAIILFVFRVAISWENFKIAASVYTVFGYAGEAISVAAVQRTLVGIELDVVQLDALHLDAVHHQREAVG